MEFIVSMSQDAPLKFRILWSDHNNNKHAADVEIMIAPHDKPRTLQISTSIISDPSLLELYSIITAR